LETKGRSCEDTQGEHLSSRARSDISGHWDLLLREQGPASPSSQTLAAGLRECISVGLSHLVCGTLSWWPQETDLLFSLPCVSLYCHSAVYGDRLTCILSWIGVRLYIFLYTLLCLHLPFLDIFIIFIAISFLTMSYLGVNF
jgi:hypothetical protein